MEIGRRREREKREREREREGRKRKREREEKWRENICETECTPSQISSLYFFWLLSKYEF